MADFVLLENPTDSATRFTKGDPNDVRLGDLMKFQASKLDHAALLDAISRAKTALPNAVTFVGYPDDDGIRANGGRVGAKLGPSRVRHFFQRMTPPAIVAAPAPGFILDLGDVPVAGDIVRRHVVARTVARAIHETGLRTFSCGGGHDYGFPDAAAFCESVIATRRRPLVVNFDAHLDVRPLDHGITSGTPFFRLLEEFPEIDFHELGLQSQCNARAHVDWLKARGGHISFEEERASAHESLLEVLQRQLGKMPHAPRPTFLSVDIDAFSSSIAPGASQSWPTGFQAGEFFQCFSWCLKNLDVRGVGVYEVSPPLDVDDRTARLAALIAHRFVFKL